MRWHIWFHHAGHASIKRIAHYYYFLGAQKVDGRLYKMCENESKKKSTRKLDTRVFRLSTRRKINLKAKKKRRAPH